MLIFSGLLKATLHSPMSRFELTPIGRFMNRFGSDMATIDYVLPFSVRSMINCIIGLLSTCLLLSVIHPWFLLVILAVVAPYSIMQVCDCWIFPQPGW